MAKITTYIKNIFYILIALQIAPLLISSIYKQYSAILEPKSKVGVITIKGAIGDAKPYVKAFKTLFEDNSIKAILVHIECPGSFAGTAQALFQEIKALKQIHIKPVISLVENVCASGGYYVACATDYIVTTPAAFVGSIGVYLEFAQLKEFVEQFKIKYDIVKSGDYKTIGHWMKDITPEQQALLQGLTNDTYEQFVKDVSQSRPKLTLDTANEWANGKIFTGRQAFALGLVDELGSISVAEKALRQRALIEGQIEWEHVSTSERSLWKYLTGSTDELSESNNIIESATQSALSALQKRSSVIHS